MVTRLLLLGALLQSVIVPPTVAHAEHCALDRMSGDQMAEMGEHEGHPMPQDHSPAPDHQRQCPMVTHCPATISEAAPVTVATTVVASTAQRAVPQLHRFISRAPEPPTPPPNRSLTS